MAEVEFWSDVVAGFSEPVPEYDMQQVTLWVPREQAVAMGQTQAKREGKAQDECGSSDTESRNRDASRSPNRAR